MLKLRDLHSLIHAYGYGVHGSHPGKNLADAMGYEVEQGRADRIERGRYAARSAPGGFGDLGLAGGDPGHHGTELGADLFDGVFPSAACAAR